LKKWLERRPKVKGRERDIQIARGRWMLPEGICTEVISASILPSEQITGYEPAGRRPVPVLPGRRTARRELPMSWKHRWPERIPRPKARRLTDKESSTVLAALTRAIAASPVLSYLGVQVRAQRGRFYLERKTREEDEAEVEVLGRITPLAAAKGAMLLETENRSGSWSEEAKGTAQKVIKAVASDTEGTFHGLGSIDKVLREYGKGLTRLPVKKVGKNKFVYSETAAVCGVQETLFHYFGLPLEVIAEPSEWYSYHREPEIVASSKDTKLPCPASSWEHRKNRWLLVAASHQAVSWPCGGETPVSC
jgi:hypothetical protein